MSAVLSSGCGASGQDNAQIPAASPDASAPSGDAASDVLAAPPDSSDAHRSGPLVAYASGSSSSIAIFAVDPATGALTPKSTVTASGGNPSFLATSPDVAYLYAISEVNTGRVGAYTIDGASGGLTFLNDVSSMGSGPAHVSVDATGKHVFVANYGDGTVAVLPVLANGHLGEATDSRSVGANAHMIVAEPSNRFVFVPCKGADYVAQFHLDTAQGKLVPNATPHVMTRPGAGPRHIAFHPGGKLAYVINESDSTMTAYALDGNGVLTEIETISTVSPGFSGANTGAEVWVHPSGKFVYGSNRGDDTIVVFAIDTTGKMTLKGHSKTGGATPRSFTLDPTGMFLYAANQGSNNVAWFKIDPLAGTLASVGPKVTTPAPAFVGVIQLK